MKLGIMQPYIFPYIGYFQLAAAVDKFVVYDDVTFIKQGWINRNRILLNCEPHLFTVPLKNASSYTAIKDTELNQNLFPNWRVKFLKTLTQQYAKAPQYPTVYPLIEEILNSPCDNISQLAAESIIRISQWLGITTEFVRSSAGYGNNHLSAATRVKDICRIEGATAYINPIGGTELYDKEDFSAAGMELYFVKSRPISYQQYNCTFVPWLSVIDVLMFNSIEDARQLVSQYDLV